MLKISNLLSLRERGRGEGEWPYDKLLASLTLTLSLLT
jgi:hypothetical protein